MIDLQIDTEGYDLDDELRARIEDRLGGLDEFMDTLERGHVTVSWEGGRNEQTRIRAQVEGPDHGFAASATEWKAVTAVDEARKKLESQIREAHGKAIDERDHKGHHHG